MTNNFDIHIIQRRLFNRPTNKDTCQVEKNNYNETSKLASPIC